MYPIIRCYTCNTSLGEFYDAYLAMKNQLYREHFLKELSDIDIFKLELDNVVNINTEEIFNILNIHNYCCRTRLMTNVESISYLE
jgi:DNA-directed RNA polymerase subunit N (RpoN/RPB10)